MAKSMKQEAVCAIKSAFDEMKYIYEYQDEVSRFLIRFNLNASIDTTSIILIVRDNFYVAYATVNLTVNKNIDKAYEFISRVNSNLLNGNFEFDSKTGKIRYKIFVDFGDQIPLQNTILRTIKVAVSMLDLYIDGFLKVITCDASAQDIIDEIDAHSDGKNL